MFRVLHYIDEVHKEQSFSKAAAKLYLSQSSLSLTIKKHEQKIGIQIFDRSTSPIKLTEAGKIYMDGVQQILAIQRDLDTYLDDYKALKTGALSIGAPHMFSSYLLPPLISSFVSAYPGVKIRLVEDDFLSLQAMVLAGEVDLLIESESFDQTLFHSVALFAEHILLAVPAGDPVNRELSGLALGLGDVFANRHLEESRAAVPLERFHSHPFLLLEKGHDMAARAGRICHRHGFEPQAFMVLNQLMTVYNLVDRQLGVAFVTDTVAKLSGKGDNILFYKIADSDAVRRINMAHKLHHYVSRPMQEFIRVMPQLCGAGIEAAMSPPPIRREPGNAP